MKASRLLLDARAIASPGFVRNALRAISGLHWCGFLSPAYVNARAYFEHAVGVSDAGADAPEPGVLDIAASMAMSDEAWPA
jgi:hypothetical protein